MTDKKKISIAVIRRLPRYYRYLADLNKAGVQRISSGDLSKKMGVTASQIRQDLNCFGGYGQQGYGYNIKSLYSEISGILGVTEKFKTVIIGAGNIGQALAHYPNLSARGYDITAIFDINPAIIGSKINGVEVYHTDKLETYIAKHKTDIAILSVPFDQTRALAERVAKCGVKGLWNFSPMDLQIDRDIVIENVHLTDSLMVLGYMINHKD
jgi:redox-sensing transcriptional repressor